MKKADLLSTLFVGIDISSRENVVAVMDFESTKPIASFAVPNNEPGAEEMAKKISTFITPESGLKKLVIGLESTSFYGVHIANYLSTCRELMPFHTEVYCLNPKSIANYKKSYIGLSKNDYIDAFVIADFARVGRITTKPWRGCQYLALQRLTRHRLHLVKALTRERPICYLTYSSSSASLLCWILRSSHSPMNSELQHLRFLPNSSLLKRLLTCLWKACRIHLRERSQQISRSTENSQALAGSCKKFIPLGQVLV